MNRLGLRPLLGAWCALSILLALGVPAHAATPASITVDADTPGAKIGPLFYGLMTEEINHSYDGGLYAELIQNRAFHGMKGDAIHYSLVESVAHWSLVKSGAASASMQLDASNPVNTTGLTTSLRLDAHQASESSPVGVANDGYWGIPVWPKTKYRAAVWARAGRGFSGPLVLSIKTNDGKTTFARAEIPHVGAAWKKYQVELTTGNVPVSTANRFVVSMKPPGTVWLGFVSLFPPTYKNGPNGTRIDIMEKLAGLNPRFLRFPGGGYLEGYHIDDRFDWKKMIGPVEERPGHVSCWNYFSSDGFGLLEFLEWCEDLHMEPILGIYAGFSVLPEVATPEQMKQFVQDVLDEIEYVTGDVKTTWGARRAADGHPAPFRLRYVEIGNEDGGFGYPQRFAAFYDAIKAKYPEIKVIATCDVPTRRADIVDEHLYARPETMLRKTDMYDHRDGKVPPVFVGEWATSEGKYTSTFRAALCDAAWLTALQRNSEAVVMNCYAPLFVNAHHVGPWQPNLIGYDAATCYGSTSYYAQAITVEVLTGQPDDQNTVEHPTKIVPKQEQINNAGPRLTHSFPANSVSVLRLKARVIPSSTSRAEPPQATIRVRNHILDRLSPDLIGFNFEDLNYQTYGGVCSQLLHGQDFEEHVDIDDLMPVPPPLKKYLYLRRMRDGSVKLVSFGVERGDRRETFEGWKDGVRVDVGSQCVPLDQFSPEVQAEIHRRITGDRQVSSYWWPIVGGNARARFTLSTDLPFNGLQDQRIEFLDGEGEVGIGNLGLFRRGIRLEAGKPYEGLLRVRCEKPQELHVSLRGPDGAVLAEKILPVGRSHDGLVRGFEKIEFTLTPAASALGSFAITLKSPGAVTMGYAFLQPGPWGRYEGLPVKKELVEAIRGMHPRVIRYNGGMISDTIMKDTYRWKNMIGPRDLRMPFIGTFNPFPAHGFGIFEFLDLARAIGVIGVVGVRSDESPQDYVELLEYANGPTDSRWGALRAQHGHPRPYALKYIEFGNEEGPNAEHAEKFKAVARAVWAKYPDVVFVMGDSWASEETDEKLDRLFRPDEPIGRKVPIAADLLRFAKAHRAQEVENHGLRRDMDFPGLFVHAAADRDDRRQAAARKKRMEVSRTLPWVASLALAAVMLPARADEPAAGSLSPANLRVEYLSEPLGVDVPRPRFFWQDVGCGPNARQTAYQLQVCRGDRDVWDSGKVLSDETIQVSYGGDALTSSKGSTAEPWPPASPITTNGRSTTRMISPIC